MRNHQNLLFTGLILSTTMGCGDCRKQPPPLPSASASASAEEAAPSASASGAAPAGVKGSTGAEGAAGAAAASTGSPAAGSVVIKSHELPAPTKPIAAFKPDTSGFKFQNYGNPPGVTNLTSTEVRRMFGDQVCGSLEGDKCVLTPAAERWMEGSNKAMGGGHCEGFAALVVLMERGQIDPKLFGADTVPQLELGGNDKLQREIAYWFITQSVMPMARAEDKTLTPAQVVEKLGESFKTSAETYTLGIYAEGYKMGHATTPYALEQKEGDVVWIMHYDNNYPNQPKYIEVDKKANTWKYTTAADPSAAEHAYVGNADTKTLTIAPTAVRTGPMICHFCGAVDGEKGAAAKGSAKGAAGAATVEMREIALQGDADLLITDEGGKKLGYEGGKFVNEIPGAIFAADKSADEAASEDEPTYFVPAGKKLKVTLDGSNLKKESESEVTLIGAGYVLAVEGVKLDAGQKDDIEFSADGKVIKYTTKSAETPTLVVGIETSGADYELEVKVTGETAGQSVELKIDLEKGTFGITVHGDAASKPELEVKLTRIDKGGEEVFHNKGVSPAADQTVLLGYGAWKGNKTPLHVTVVDAKGAVVKEEDVADDN